MREHVDIDVLVNWVTMLRADVEGAILLSDDDTDALFYERCIHERARVVPAQDATLTLLDRVELRGVRGVVATLHCAQEPPRPNVFHPFLGDVASVLLFSKSSDGVIKDVCGNPWLVACGKEVGRPIRDHVAYTARLLNDLRRLYAEVRAPQPDVSELVWDSFHLDWERIGQTLIGRGLTQQQLDCVRDVPTGDDLRCNLIKCDGMDAIGIFAAATKMYRPRGISPTKTIDPPNLLTMLRVAFDLSDFEEDPVFWQMRRWERINPRYPLLRRWRVLDPLGVVWDQRYWKSDLSIFLGLLPPGEYLAIFKIDLDHFKPINDSLGHTAGDAALRFYCAIVKKVLGGVGEVYRRGGDEVVVIAPSLNEQRARDLAERLRQAIEAEFKTWAIENGLNCMPPTASIGLVLATTEKSADEFVQLADQAEQQAKQQGKNRVFVLI